MKETRVRSVSLFVLLCGCLMAAQTAVPTYQMDNNRSGANTTETILTPSNVNVSTFGRGMVYLVEGYVYAQPLYVPNVNINGTSHNVLYRGHRARSALCLRREDRTSALGNQFSFC